MKRSSQDKLDEDGIRRQPGPRLDGMLFVSQESAVDFQEQLELDYNTAEDLDVDPNNSLQWTQNGSATPSFIFTDWDLQNYQAETSLSYTNSTTDPGTQDSSDVVCAEASGNISSTRCSEIICFGMVRCPLTFPEFAY